MDTTSHWLASVTQPCVGALGDLEMVSATDGTSGEILLGHPILVDGFLRIDGRGDRLRKLDFLKILVINARYGLLLRQKLERAVVAHLIDPPG